MARDKEASRKWHATWYQKHKEEVREKKKLNMRIARAANPEKHAAHSRAAKAKLKASVFDLYGRVCVGCGFSDIRALTLDHILNNGSQERAELGERGVYRRAVDQHRPHEYQTLCMNCQFIKRVEAGRQNQHSHSHGASSAENDDV